MKRHKGKEHMKEILAVFGLVFSLVVSVAYTASVEEKAASQVVKPAEGWTLHVDRKSISQDA